MVSSIESGTGAHEDPTDSGTLREKSSSLGVRYDIGRSFIQRHLSKEDELYGRSKELQRVHEVYELACRPSEGSSRSQSAQFILISGSSGVGKTTLAYSLRSRVVREDNGYFLIGKFDQRQSRKRVILDQGIHEVFVVMLEQLALRIRERGEHSVQVVREAVHKALGTDIQVLTDRVPELGEVLLNGKEKRRKRTSRVSRETTSQSATSSSDLEDTSLLGSLLGRGSEAALNDRFRYIARKLLRAVACPKSPLVLVFDDIQWADEVGIGLLRSLAAEVGGTEILFLATARRQSDQQESAEVATRNVTDTLSWLMDHGVRVTELELNNFQLQDIEQMVSDSFRLGTHEAMSVSSLVHNVTKGNAFFVCEFLRTLVSRRSLRFDPKAGVWRTELEEIRVDFRNVKDLIRASIAKLSTEAQEILSLMSCFGKEVDENLIRCLKSDSIGSLLTEVANAGLLVHDEDQHYWLFTHDAILEAAYENISIEERRILHHSLGKRLWRYLDVVALDSFIFVVIEQLLLGADEVEDAREKVAIAKLCLRAGERAVKLAQFRSGYTYLVGGVELLGSRPWGTDYRVSLSLHTMAAELAYFTGRFDRVEKHCNEVIKHASSLDDMLQGHIVRIYGLVSCERVGKGVESGLVVLRELGEVFSAKPSWFQVFRRFKRLRRTLRCMTNEMLLRLPVVDNSRSLATMQVLYLVSTYANLISPQLATLLSIRSAELTLERGLCALSTISFSMIGALLCGAGKDIKEGYRIGRISYAICERFGESAWVNKIAPNYFGYVHAWVRPIQETIEPIRLAASGALDRGDNQVFLWNLSYLCWNQFDSTPIPLLERDAANVLEWADHYKNETISLLVKPHHQLWCNLQGRAQGDPAVLTGESMDESQYEAMKDSIHVYEWAQSIMGVTSFLFGNYEKSQACFNKCRNFMLNYPLSSPGVGMLLMYDSLAYLAQARIQKKRRRQIKKTSKRWAVRMDCWAKSCPHNFLGKKYLVDAEFACTLGDNDNVFTHYTCAIALSEKSGFFLQAALANELTGRFLVRQGEKQQAVQYFDEALAGYARWGATAKANHLRESLASERPLWPSLYESTGGGGLFPRQPADSRSTPMCS